MLGVLKRALLIIVALCAAAGPLQAQEWTAHSVPLFMSVTNPLGHQGFVRVINHSEEAGEVLIDAVDDVGVSYAPVTLDIGAGEAVHFNSADLEAGNATKGLFGGTGTGTGNWRLRLRSRLDIEVLAYNRTGDGLLAGLYDLVPRTVVRRPEAGGEAMGHRVAIFNPASNVNQVSRLRVINPGEESATVSIEGVDDKGMSPGVAVEFSLPGGASHTVTSQELESGQGEGLAGMLDDGEGKWQLVVTADEPVEVMSLLTSPTGHLTNLSSEPHVGEEGAVMHNVPLFAAVANPYGYQGFVRVINASEEDGEVTVEAFDDAGAEYAPVTFDIGAGQTVHFNSDDLEFGNDAKGLSAGIGAGTGDWRLRLRSDLDIEVLAYNRTNDGLLTTLHDVVPYTEVSRPGGWTAVEGYYVAIFNPASNDNQVSRLRIINPGAQSASVSIEGFDDAGASPGGEVRLTVPGGAARTLTSQALESGQWTGESDIEGLLGDGKGKWRLVVASEEPLVVMSLLASPTGHLVNLSTAGPAGRVVTSPVVSPRSGIAITGNTTAYAGTPVALSAASVGTDEVPIERYVWYFSDGQTATGPEVTIHFADAGLYEVTVRAMNGSYVVAEATTAVAVFDTGSGANPGLPSIPRVFGDVGLDGSFGPEDLELAEQSVAGERTLVPAAIDAGDLDLSGALDALDVELMKQAIDRGTELPSGMLSKFAYPMGVVALVSPGLLDADAEINIFVDGEPSPYIMRTILGYATFVVPPSLTGDGNAVDVVIEANGTVADRMTILLQRTPDKPTVSAKTDVMAFFGELAQVLARYEGNSAALLETLSETPEHQAAIVLGAPRAAAIALEAATAELDVLLAGAEGEELSALIQTALYANGLAEFREAVRPNRSRRQSGEVPNALRTPVYEDEVCDEYVPKICSLRAADEWLSLASASLTAACTVGALSGIVIGGPVAGSVVLAAFLKICTPLHVALKFPVVVGVVARAIDLDIRLAADRTILRLRDSSQEERETAAITAEVVFGGLDELCGPAGFKVSGVLLEAIVKSLIKSSMELKLIYDALETFNKERFLLDAVRNAVKYPVTQLGLSAAFKHFLTSICEQLGVNRSVGLMADAGNFALQVSNGGRLSPQYDDSNNYTGRYELACPEGFSGKVTVRGKKELCGVVGQAVVTVSCDAACKGPFVHIPDDSLRSVVEDLLDKTSGEPITTVEMASLTRIISNRNQIGSLAGLECATGVRALDFFGTQISDLTPLSGLKNLKALVIYGSQVVDVSPLSDLTQLTSLTLSANEIVDVSPLSDLTALTRLVIVGNRIVDLSPLSDLTALTRLILGGNRIVDLSPLSNLTALTSLYLRENEIVDVSPLSDLTALTRLGLVGNRIVDLSPLSDLTALTILDLDENEIVDVSPLSEPDRVDAS